MGRFQCAVFVACVGLAGPALAQPSSPPPAMDMASPAGHALVKSMDNMNSGMAAPMTGDADQDFARMMLAHHQGAVDMAKVELRYGKDPVLRRMSAQIIATQTAEIAEFQAWQVKHPAAR